MVFVRFTKGGFYKDLYKETQQSLINRDLSNVDYIIEKIRDING